MGAHRRTKQIFGNDSPCQCDQFCPKIVEIGAILAIFRPFEIFSNFFSLPWAVNHMNENMKQLNPRLHFDTFAKFFDVFARFLKFSDVFGPVGTCLDVFGYVWMHSDSSGRVRMRSDAFRKFRICSRKMIRDIGFCVFERFLERNNHCIFVRIDLRNFSMLHLPFSLLGYLLEDIRNTKSSHDFFP